MIVEIAHLTDIGCVREENEDSVYIDPEGRTFIVADGMGGHNAGEVASQMACEIIGNQLAQIEEGHSVENPLEWMERAVLQAHEAITETAHQNPDYHGMGTTVEVLWLDNRKAYWGHVGDSRIYHIRNGDFKQITQDHSLINEYIQKGVLNPEEAWNSPMRHVILQALGSVEDIEVETGSVDLKAGDLFLICSDGLTDVIKDKDLQELLFATQDLDVAVHNAIEQVKQLGAPDNISLILIRLS